MKQKDNVILITGGASSLGAAIARRLASDGARLALTYHQGKARAEELKRELTAKKVDVDIFEADLSDPKTSERLVDSVVKKYKRLDVLINNASIFPDTPFGSVSEKTWDAVMNANARGPFLLIQAAVASLRTSKGTVINISDVYGKNPILQNKIPYCVSKAALNAVTQAYAHALAPDIRVHAVAPGAITFPESYGDEEKKRLRAHIPLGREGSAADIAEAVAFLLEHDHYMTGQILSVDGGRFI